MPKIKQVAENKYEYKCACGKIISLEWDKREPAPTKLVKCFECGKKESEEKDKCQKQYSSARNAEKK